MPRFSRRAHALIVAAAVIVLPLVALRVVERRLDHLATGFTLPVALFGLTGVAVLVLLVFRNARPPAPARPAETPYRRFGRVLWWVLVAAFVAAVVAHLVTVTRVLSTVGPAA